MSEHCIERGLVENAQPVVDALRASRLCAVTAESCTGGLVAAILSHALRAGECLHGGYVVYSKAQKSSALGVDLNLLETKGSVNAQVALQMAQGALARSSATVAVAVTGVLGPDPDEDNNPPGLLYVATCRKGFKPLLSKLQYTDANPDTVRRRAVEESLQLLLRAARM